MGLPPNSFWTAHVKDPQSKGPSSYIGMTEANSTYMAKRRILKQWKGQGTIVDQINEGKLKLILRRKK